MYPASVFVVMGLLGLHQTAVAQQPFADYAKNNLKLEFTPGDEFVAQVKDYLEGKTPFLRGIAEPVVPVPASPEAAAPNRRVEFRIMRIASETTSKEDYELIGGDN